MNRRTAIAASLATAASLTLPRAARAAQPLRLATIPIDSGAQVIYGVERGTFKNHGLETDLQYIGNGAQIVAAVVGGAVDVGYTNVISLAVAHARGLPLVVVGPASLYTSKAPTSALMVATGSPIKSARDCAGKTIGVSSLKSITQYSTEAWLDANGGDAKSVRFIELEFPEIGPALAQGRIDIGHFAEPFLSDAKKTARVLGDSYDAVAPNFMISIYVATPAFVAANADVVKRFGDALRETAGWANAHRAESGQILAAAAKMDPATVATMTRATYAEHLTAADLQPNIDVTARYGGLAAFPAVDLLPKA
jgi:NitT/TauT family transport system substrate-binding protein